MDLSKNLIGESEEDSIYKAINDIGSPCVTTKMYQAELISQDEYSAKKKEILDSL